MNDQMAKMKVLQQIMDLFTDKQLGGLKKKGQPDMMAISVKADADKDPLAALAGKGDDSDDSKDESDGDEDPDMLRKLAELYGSDDDDKKPVT